MDFYTDTAVKFVGLLTEESYSELRSFNTLERWFIASPVAETTKRGIKRHELTQPNFDLGPGKAMQSSPPSLILLGKVELNSFPLCLLHSAGLLPVWEVCWQYTHSYSYQIKTNSGKLVATFYDEELVATCLTNVKHYTLVVETLDESGALIDTQMLFEFIKLQST